MLASIPLYTDLKHIYLLQNLCGLCVRVLVCAHGCIHKYICTYLHLCAYMIANWLKQFILKVCVAVCMLSYILLQPANSFSVKRWQNSTIISKNTIVNKYTAGSVKPSMPILNKTKGKQWHFFSLQSKTVTGQPVHCQREPWSQGLAAALSTLNTESSGARCDYNLGLCGVVVSASHSERLAIG